MGRRQKRKGGEVSEPQDAGRKEDVGEEDAGEEDARKCEVFAGLLACSESEKKKKEKKEKKSKGSKKSKKKAPPFGDDPLGDAEFERIQQSMLAARRGE